MGATGGLEIWAQERVTVGLAVQIFPKLRLLGGGVDRWSFLSAVFLFLAAASLRF